VEACERRDVTVRGAARPLGRAGPQGRGQLPNAPLLWTKHRPSLTIGGADKGSASATLVVAAALPDGALGLRPWPATPRCSPRLRRRSIRYVHVLCRSCDFAHFCGAQLSDFLKFFATKREVFDSELTGLFRDVQDARYVRTRRLSPLA
jgi:hypothetical protein